jgi:hypothetical protein
VGRSKKRRVRGKVKNILEMTYGRGDVRKKTVNAIVEAVFISEGTTQEEFEKELEKNGCNSGRNG